MVDRQNQAWRLIARSFIGLVVSSALVLQLLLIGLASGSLAAAASSSDDPFVICYGGGTGDGIADHDPARKAAHTLHCLLVCAQAHGSSAATLPAFASPVVFPPTAVELAQPDTPICAPAERSFAHSSRGPPTSA